jgi:hypothetical protein
MSTPEGVVKLYPIDIKVTVYNDSWRFQLTYVPQSLQKRSFQDLRERPLSSLLVGSNALVNMGFILSYDGANEQGCLHIPVTATNIEVNNHIMVPIMKKKMTPKVTYNAKSRPAEISRVQFLLGNAPVLENAAVLVQSKGGATRVAVQGDVVGICNNVLLMNNIKSATVPTVAENLHEGEDHGEKNVDHIEGEEEKAEEGDENSADYVAYLKHKEYTIVGKQGKMRKLHILEAFGDEEAPADKLLVHFDIPFFLNTLSKFETLKNTNLSSRMAIDQDTGYSLNWDRIDLETLNNYTTNSNNNNNGNNQQDNFKSWYINHNMSIRVLRRKEDRLWEEDGMLTKKEKRNEVTPSETMMMIGSLAGQVKSTIILKPNVYLPFDNIQLNKTVSKITLMPSDNLSLSDRNFIRSKMVDESGSNNERSHSRKKSYTRRSFQVATVRAQEEFETSAPNPTAFPDNLSPVAGGNGEDDGWNGKKSMSGTALTAKHHIFSGKQEVYYKSGQYDFLAKEFLCFGWKFQPNETLDVVDSTSTIYCSLNNVIVFKEKSFKEVKRGVMVVYDKYDDKIKGTSSPQLLNEEGFMREEPGREVLLTAELSHMFVPSPERCKLTRKLINQTENIEESGKMKHSETIYEMKMKHVKGYQNQTTTVVAPNPDGGEDASVDPDEEESIVDESKYLLLFFIHNASRVTLVSNAVADTKKKNTKKKEVIQTTSVTFLPLSSYLSDVSAFTQTYPELATYRREIEKFIVNAGSETFGYYTEYNPNQLPHSNLILCCMVIDKNWSEKSFMLKVDLETMLRQADGGKLQTISRRY